MTNYFIKNIGLKGIPKFGNLPLDFFTFLKVEILETESLVHLRFHSSLAFCKASSTAMIEQHGYLNARVFTYPGIDKTESELIDWLLSNELTANDGKTYDFTKAKAV